VLTPSGKREKRGTFRRNVRGRNEINKEKGKGKESPFDAIGKPITHRLSTKKASATLQLMFKKRTKGKKIAEIGQPRGEGITVIVLFDAVEASPLVKWKKQNR